MGVEVEDGVGGPAGFSEGGGVGEDVEEDTEEWLIPSTWPYRQTDRQEQSISKVSLKKFHLKYS